MQSSSIVVPYNKPPITEAVIGITFEKAIDEKGIRSVSKKFAKHYSNSQPVRNLSVNVAIDNNVPKSPTTNYTETLGQKLSSTDLTELLVVWPTTLTVSQLAPYPGWDAFIERFIRDWKIWKRAFKHKKISRIGVRFINRIDIPSTDPEVRHEEFLNIYPRVPANIPTLDAYSLNIVAKLDHIGCHLKINSAVVPPQLLDHTSFLIDQDIHIDALPPQNDEDIYALLNKIRVEKNKVFESCISDKTREFFRNE